MNRLKAIATIAGCCALSIAATAQQTDRRALAEQRLDSTKRVLEEQREIFEKAQQDYMKAFEDYTQEELQTKTDATYQKLQEVRDMLAEIGKVVGSTTKRIAVEAQAQVNDSVIQSVKDTIVVKASDMGLKIGEVILEGLNQVSQQLDESIRKQQEAQGK